jgi:hypothetical protein
MGAEEWAETSARCRQMAVSNLHQLAQPAGASHGLNPACVEVDVILALAFG